MSSSPPPSSTPPTVSDPALAKYKAEIIELAGGPLDPKDVDDPASQRGNMGHIHWLFINALESVWEGAEKCKGDEANFLAYALVVAREIEQHHHAEETIYFPFLISKGVTGLDHNVEEHKAMHDKLDSLISYITNLQSNLEKFNPTELRGKMIPLLEELVPHLRHELDTLSPEKLSPHLGYEEMVEMNKMIEKMLQSYDSSVVLPFFVINANPGSHFPPLPFFVRRVLLPGLIKRKHAALWKYGKHPREVDLW